MAEAGKHERALDDTLPGWGTVPSISGGRSQGTPEISGFLKKYPFRFNNIHSEQGLELSVFDINATITERRRVEGFESIIAGSRQHYFASLNSGPTPSRRPSPNQREDRAMLTCCSRCS